MNTAIRRAASVASSRNSPMRIATSKFSPMRSTKRAERSTSSVIAGYLSTNSASSGARTMLAMSLGIVTRRRPLGSTLPVLGQRRRGGHVLDDVMRVLEHRVPEVGDGELARGAQQQALAQLGFQGRHASRDRRLGEAQALGGARKAALIDDAREEEEVVGLEVHGGWARSALVACMRIAPDIVARWNNHYPF